MTGIDKLAMTGALSRSVGRFAGQAGNLVRRIGVKPIATAGVLGGGAAGGLWMANRLRQNPTGPSGIFNLRNSDLENIYGSMPSQRAIQ